jgi:hypothetical protein
MKHDTIALSVLLAVSIGIRCSAQSGAVIPQGGAGHADKASCVILKRMGPADQVTSRLYSFGIRGKQFQLLCGGRARAFSQPQPQNRRGTGNRMRDGRLGLARRKLKFGT